MLKPFHKKLSLFFVFLTIPFVGCNDTMYSSIPDFPVYIELKLTAQYPTFKNSLGQFLTTEKNIFITSNERSGFGGVVVCTGIMPDEFGKTQYFAFDMACPYETKKDIKVRPDTTGLPYLICEKCGSVYDVGFGNGNPLSGPAKEYLKKYNATSSGDVLYINR